MPHRAYHIALGVAGLLAVLALLLAGANLLRHSCSGPAWKQRLVSAGLMLFGALGFGSLGGAGCTKEQTPSAEPKVSVKKEGTAASAPDAAPPAGKTAALAPVEQINKAQAEAEVIASGKKGRYPFDRAGKKRVLVSLERARSLVDGLHRSGEINEAEAGMWKAELTLLTQKVGGFRPTERKNATCYRPMLVQSPSVVSLARLRERLPLLDKLAAATKLNPAVTRKVLARIDADLQTIAPSSDKDKELATKARALVANLRTRLGKSALNQGTDGEWEVVREAWRFIAPLAAASSKSTTAQRKQADEKMKNALAAVDRMVAAGKLHKAEASLLKAESERLKWNMYRSPPADRRVKCYKRKRIVPAEASLARIERRLPLLQQLVKRNKLSPKVLSRVLPTLERDVQVLSTPAELDQLEPEQKAQASRAARRARSMLAKLRRSAK